MKLFGRTMPLKRADEVRAGELAELDAEQRPALQPARGGRGREMLLDDHARGAGREGVAAGGEIGAGDRLGDRAGDRAGDVDALQIVHAAVGRRAARAAAGWRRSSRTRRARCRPGRPRRSVPGRPRACASATPWAMIRCTSAAVSASCAGTAKSRVWPGVGGPGAGVGAAAAAAAAAAARGERAGRQWRCGRGTLHDALISAFRIAAAARPRLARKAPGS